MVQFSTATELNLPILPRQSRWDIRFLVWDVRVLVSLLL